MKKRVVLVRHGDDPPDDRVFTYLVTRGFTPDLRKPFAGQALGEVGDDVAGTVLYGGPYNVFDVDEHPFLREEYRWIDACLRAEVPMLGICQGAQQIAYHLGARVGPKPDSVCEFGYYPLYPAPGAKDFLPGPMRVTQSHFHGFELPAGGERLARSDSFENQAFRYGRNAYGFQFHAEVTIEGFRRWQNAPRTLYGHMGAQTREEQDRLMQAHDAAQADWFYGFLGRLFEPQNGEAKA